MQYVVVKYLTKKTSSKNREKIITNILKKPCRLNSLFNRYVSTGDIMYKHVFGAIIIIGTIIISYAYSNKKAQKNCHFSLVSLNLNPVIPKISKQLHLLTTQTESLYEIDRVLDDARKKRAENRETVFNLAVSQLSENKFDSSKVYVAGTKNNLYYQQQTKTVMELFQNFVKSLDKTQKILLTRKLSAFQKTCKI